MQVFQNLMQGIFKNMLSLLKKMLKSLMKHAEVFDQTC